MDIKSQGTVRGFPNPFLPEEEKAKKDFGLKTLKAMWAEHDSGSNNFFDQRNRFISLRNWAMGTPDVSDYKDRETMEDGNTSLLSKDFTPAAAGVLKNLINISTNKLIDRPYDIIATAVDKDSTDKLDKRMKEMFGKVKVKAALKAMEAKGEDTSGLDSVKESVKDAPDTIDEVQFDAELSWKTEEEESIENGIRYVLNNNSFEEIKKTISRDLHVLDSAGTWTRYNDNGDIKVDSIDRKNLVYSYFTRPDASDATYVGIVLEMTINELRKRASGELSEMELFSIAQQYSGATGGLSNGQWTSGAYYQEGNNSSAYDNFNVLVMFGQFKSENTKVWREKESKKGNSKSFDKVPSNYTEFYTDKDGIEKKKRGVTEVIRKSVIDVYEGYYVCNTDKCFGYKPKENVLRKVEDQVVSTDAEFDIIFYTPAVQDTTSKGMAESMIPYVRQLINIEQKIQHLISQARPKNVAIDISALQGVTTGMGTGGIIGDKGLAEIYDKTGRLYYRTHDKNGKAQTLTGQPPIRELENGLSSDVERLIGIYNHWVVQMRQVSGINESIDGIANPKGALVGIEENRETAYNSATKHLTDAYTNIIERTADRIALMIKHNINRGVKVKGYKMAMGSLRVEVLKASKGLTNAQLGIKLNYKPSEKQKALFEESVKIGLQQGQISVSGANRSREVLESGSYKAANEYLAREVDKFMQKAHQQSMELQQANGQVQIQSNQAAKAGEAELLQMKHQMDMAKLQSEYQFKIELEKAKAGEKRLETVLKGEVDQDLIKTSMDVNADTEVLNNTGTPSKQNANPSSGGGKRGIPQPNRSTPRPADDASKRASNIAQ